MRRRDDRVSYTDVDSFHARGAGERAHEPVVDAAHVVVVHAGEETDWLPDDKVKHTDGTPVWERSNSGIVNQ